MKPASRSELLVGEGPEHPGRSKPEETIKMAVILRKPVFRNLVVLFMSGNLVMILIRVNYGQANDLRTRNDDF